jgi:proline iminopeptidase
MTTGRTGLPSGGATRPRMVTVPALAVSRAANRRVSLSGCERRSPHGDLGTPGTADSAVLAVIETREEIVELDDGARLWTVTHGEGRPMICCHGGPGGTDTLAPLARMIADMARVHRYDQRACGRSSGGPPFTMARWIADLEGLRRHWGHRRWVVAGHSFGAALALAYALEHPERTEAIVYLSCVVRLHGQPDWYDQYRQARRERMTPELRRRYLELRRRRDAATVPSPALEAELRMLSARTDFADPTGAEQLVEQQQAELAAVNSEVNRTLGVDFQHYFAHPALRERLRALDIPVLLVHGEADPRPLAAVQALATQLRHSRLVVLDGVAHFPYLEAPSDLRRVLRTWLAVASR